MKTKIHPKYQVCNVSCGCGNKFVTRSTIERIHVEICSACHPFYTGKQKFVDSAGRVEMLVPRINVEGTLKFVQDVKADLRDSLPELAFDELKSKEKIATATLEIQLTELVLKVKRSRPNYDAGLVQALRMAGMAAKNMSMSDIAVLDDPMLKLDGKRPVLPLDPLSMIQLELAKITLEQTKAVGITEGFDDGDDGDDEDEGDEE